MSTEKLTLTYLNEDDRAYGLAGMAISAAALDAMDRIAKVSLDAEDTMISFSNEYFFSGSPSVSPKSTWNSLIQNFYITSAMVMSNVMARSMVRLGREVPDDIMKCIRTEMEEEGVDTCSLESDEVDTLYHKTLTGMHRIFANRSLHPAIEEFVHTLSHRRTLSGMEIYNELRSLRLI